MRRLCLCVLICLPLAALFGAPTTATAQANTPTELIELVNQFRMEQGMPALSMHPSLMAAAQGHATYQAVNYIHSHQGPGGSMPNDRAAAAGYAGLVLENVASGTLGYVSTAWAVQGWAGSPGHRRAMLSTATHIGTGIAQNDEEMFFVLLIGSAGPPWTVDPATAAPSAATPDVTPEPTDPIVIPIVLATPREDGVVVHVVQQGQTLWAIAARYGVSLDDILYYNNLTRQSIVKPGDSIIVQVGEGQPPPPTPTPITDHTVQAGESLWGIAARYGLTLDTLLALNGLERGAVIKPGDVLLVRTPDPTATVTPFPTETSTPTATNTPTGPTATWPEPYTSPLPGSSPTLTASAVPTTPAPTPTAHATQIALALPPATLAPVNAEAPVRLEQESDFDRVVIAGVIAVGVVLAGMAALSVWLMRRRA